jgi:hypothetical protein
MILVLSPLFSLDRCRGHSTFELDKPPYIGSDLHYNQSLVVYKQGTSWNVSLSVKNGYSHGMAAIAEAVNITSIQVYFDWRNCIAIPLIGQCASK